MQTKIPMIASTIASFIAQSFSVISPNATTAFNRNKILRAIPIKEIGPLL